jgi:hypothetical protein
MGSANSLVLFYGRKISEMRRYDPGELRTEGSSGNFLFVRSLGFLRQDETSEKVELIQLITLSYYAIESGATSHWLAVPRALVFPPFGTEGPMDT